MAEDLALECADLAEDVNALRMERHLHRERGLFAEVAELGAVAAEYGFLNDHLGRADGLHLALRLAVALGDALKVVSGDELAAIIDQVDGVKTAIGDLRLQDMGVDPACL